jgi:hypothetical protein
MSLVLVFNIIVTVQQFPSQLWQRKMSVVIKLTLAGQYHVRLKMRIEVRQLCKVSKRLSRLQGHRKDFMSMKNPLALDGIKPATF